MPNFINERYPAPVNAPRPLPPLRITRRAYFAAACWVLLSLPAGLAGVMLLPSLVIAVPAIVMAWACFDIAGEPPTRSRLAWMGLIAGIAALAGVGLLSLAATDNAGDAYEAMAMLAGVLGGLLLLCGAATGWAIYGAGDWPDERRGPTP